ncbi:hypothetical protein BDR22DRAFT_844044 [Usnea florida]
MDLAFHLCKLPSKPFATAVVILLSAAPYALTPTSIWSGRYSSIETSLVSASCFAIEEFGSSVSQSFKTCPRHDG